MHGFANQPMKPVEAKDDDHEISTGRHVVVQYFLQRSNGNRLPDYVRVSEEGDGQVGAEVETQHHLKVGQ